MISFEEYVKSIRELEITSDCPVKNAMTLFQGKWAVFILFELMREQPQRFGSLQKKISGITNTMLTTTLRDLESRGLVNRIQYNEIPPHVEYSLTKQGKELYIVFFAMGQWAKNTENIMN